MTRIWPGGPYPLGATPTVDGTNFALASEVATAVTLCLFDDSGGESRLRLPEYDAGVWHGFVPGVGPGQRYGYRVDGPYDPAHGARCNAAKVLLDPYARAIEPGVGWHQSLSGDNPLDSAAAAPRSVVVDVAFDWGSTSRPNLPYTDSVIYEAHVKGISNTHPDVPPELRGTFAGLAHPAVIDHLTGLGVTAVELLPVHQSMTSGFLAGRGLVDYWGYNTIGYFAPHDAYSAAVRARFSGAGATGRDGHAPPGGQVAEFQNMVRSLHAAGLEVICDVVFNHTAEGNENGPTLCFRGIDNAAYYRLVDGDPAHYFDTTGTGNSLDTSHPTCLRLILDSLRHWVTVMGVDGFRFDLAATLARQDGSFSLLSAFFDVVDQDPVLNQTKLIAEPWDVGQPDSYDVGRFPGRWSEWNGRFRDTVRDAWRGVEGTLPDLATRVSGSPDLYGWSRRRPSASVNMVTTHDGFTLRDLVSYDGKHNDANGEDSGTNDNRSWNCGAEGPSTDPQVLMLRARQSRALLATLLLARGVPMLLGGDEFGRSQGGNNNAYCQDDPISWYDWGAVDQELLAFTREVIQFRRTHPVLRRRSFATARDVGWFTAAGNSMTDRDWQDPNGRAVTMHLDGVATPDLDRRGEPEPDDDLLVLVNTWWEPVTVVIPDIGWPARWIRQLDTFDLGPSHRAAPPAPPGPGPVSTPVGRPAAATAGDTLTSHPRSVLVLTAAH